MMSKNVFPSGEKDTIINSKERTVIMMMLLEDSLGNGMGYSHEWKKGESPSLIKG